MHFHHFNIYLNVKLDSGKMGVKAKRFYSFLSLLKNERGRNEENHLT